MRHPSYPAVDSAIVETNLKFGVGITNRPSTLEQAAMHEIARQFDTATELAKALADRTAAALTK